MSTEAPPARGAVSKTRLTAHALVLLLVALVVLIGMTWSKMNDANSVACEPTTVRMVVAPTLSDLADSAVESLQDNGQCIQVDVTSATVAEVSSTLADAEDDPSALPDLWIPESPAWRSVADRAGQSGRVIVPAVATTPVGLATGANTGEKSWLDALSSPELVLRSPLESGAAAMALLAPFTEPGDHAAQAQSDLVPVAQGFGEAVASGRKVKVTLDNMAAGSDRLLPATEQDFVIALRGNPNLTWTQPGEDAPMLQFPLVQPNVTGGGLSSGGAIDVAGRTAERIAAWFETQAGRAGLAADKLRPADGSPLGGGESLEQGGALPAPSEEIISSVMRSWNSLTVPSSVLGVIDASQSMTLPASGGESRLDLATGACLAALGVFPDHARIGITAFSDAVATRGRAYEVIEPLRRLDAPVRGGKTQKSVLTGIANNFGRYVGGDADLYSTALATYQSATRDYNPAYGNSVAIFTDGTEPGPLSEAELMSKLEALHDPSRPVRLIFIGIGPSADVAELQTIAETTGGAAYEASSPDDIITVLASALLSR